MYEALYDALKTQNKNEIKFFSKGTIVKFRIYWQTNWSQSASTWWKYLHFTQKETWGNFPKKEINEQKIMLAVYMVGDTTGTISIIFFTILCTFLNQIINSLKKISSIIIWKCE